MICIKLKAIQLQLTLVYFIQIVMSISLHVPMTVQLDCLIYIKNYGVYVNTYLTNKLLSAQIPMVSVQFQLNQVYIQVYNYAWLVVGMEVFNVSKSNPNAQE